MERDQRTATTTPEASQSSQAVSPQRYLTKMLSDNKNPNTFNFAASDVPPRSKHSPPKLVPKKVIGNGAFGKYESFDLLGFVFEAED